MLHDNQSQAMQSLGGSEAAHMRANIGTSQTRDRSRLIRLSVTFAAAPLLFLSMLSATSAQAPASLYGPNGVSPLAVRQGILGSCYFHASLAAVAKANPSAVRNAISGDARKGYRVLFVSGPAELVYEQDVEYAKAHNYDHSEGQWVTVLMRGYAQRELRQSMVQSVQRSTTIPAFVKPAALSALQKDGPLLVAYDRAIRSVVSQDGQLDKATLKTQLANHIHALGIPSAEAEMLSGLLDHAGFYDSLTRTVRENGEVFGAYRSVGQGGIPVSVIAAFLGAAHSARVSDSSLAAELHSLHSGGTAMVAGTRTLGVDSSDWYVPGHAYTLLDYDGASRTVLLRNPWGARPGPDGIFKLSLSEFEQDYEIYSYSDGATK
jgi:hypothetical protein